MFHVLRIIKFSLILALISSSAYGATRIDEGGESKGYFNAINFESGATVTKVGITAEVAVTGAGAPPVTTKGDIYTYSTGAARLPVGTNGQILSPDSAETTGLKWITPTSHDAVVITTPDANVTDSQAITFADTGIMTITEAANVVTFDATEVDGSTTNEINTIQGDDNVATSGLAVSVDGAGIVTTDVVGDVLTVTGTEADTLDSVADRGATTDQALTTGGIIVGDGDTVGATTNKWLFDDTGGDVSTTGNVGIGTTAPTQALDVIGKIALDGTVIAYRPTAFTGTLILGDGGGSLDTGADYNTFVGIGAGFSNTTGYYNTANGYASLLSNTTGYYNTANGYASLLSNTTGY